MTYKNMQSEGKKIQHHTKIIMSPLTIAFLFATTICSNTIANSDAKYISEFTLDELTNADASYQPFSFSAHSGGAKNAQQQQLHQNPVQMIGKFTFEKHDHCACVCVQSQQLLIIRGQQTHTLITLSRTQHTKQNTLHGY